MVARLGRTVKALIGMALIACLCGFGGRMPVELKDLRTVPCPDLPEFQNLTMSNTSSTRVNCFTIEGTAINPSDRLLYNADIFGRIYDANGNDVWPERTRLGAIEEVPPGESSFSIRISVSPSNPLPLSLEQFKAAGFSGTVNR